jgi:hypothetical protein
MLPAEEGTRTRRISGKVRDEGDYNKAIALKQEDA